MCLNDGVAPFHPSPFTVLFNSSLRVCRLPTKGNSVQRPKGLLCGCALSTQGLRYLRHGLVLPTGICSDHQIRLFIKDIEAQYGYHSSLEQLFLWVWELGKPHNVDKFLSLGKLQNYGSARARGTWKFTRNSKTLRNVSMLGATEPSKVGRKL